MSSTNANSCGAYSARSQAEQADSPIRWNLVPLAGCSGTPLRARITPNLQCQSVKSNGLSGMRLIFAGVSHALIRVTFASA